MITAIIISSTGLLLLYLGAEGLVRGSSSMGLRFGLSPLIVGLTIVAFGTSTPELAVSLSAAYMGETDLSLANILGSNIANIGLILGLSAVVLTINVNVNLIRFDIPIMITASLLMCLLLADGQLTRLDGALLFIGIISYSVFNIYVARRDIHKVEKIFESGITAKRISLLSEILYIIVGVVILTIGGQSLVEGAVTIARHLGVSEAMIGLTIVSVGTSLPELATSLLAAAKKMGDIAVGNIIGSNIFNIFGVLGASALLTPLPLGNVTWTDLSVMMVFTLAVLPLAWAGFDLTRREGLLFLGCYAGYIVWLIVIST